MQPRSTPDYSPKVMSRYTDGYCLARAIVAVGALVKTLGLVAAGVMLRIGIGMANVTNSGLASVVSIPVAGLVWLLLWVLGVLVSAQGQILKANLDEAVNTSPFLMDNQRAQIMSLT